MPDLAVDQEIVATAQRLADDVLFPAALDTDRRTSVPVSLLQALAEAGLFGLTAPAAVGGLEADEPTRMAVTEALAGGCLTTTFVWGQHHHLVQSLVTTENVALADEWLGPLARGERRAGVAFAGLRRPGAPVLTAQPDGASWVLQGMAPWVSGWGLIDAVHVAARRPGGDVVWLLLDAVEGSGLRATPLDLAAVPASATVRLELDHHGVAGHRLTRLESFTEWKLRDAASLRANGAMSLGVAGRCLRLLGISPLDGELEAARTELWSAPTGDLPAARARASALAATAAQAVVIRGGGRSVLTDDHGQRLMREAMLLQVFGQNAAIRSAQLNRLGLAPPTVQAP